MAIHIGWRKFIFTPDRGGPTAARAQPQRLRALMGHGGSDPEAKALLVESYAPIAVAIQFTDGRSKHVG